MPVQIFGATDPLARAKGQRFEYIRVQIGADGIAGSDDTLRQLGQAGWDLVSVIFTNTFVHFWLKRPLGQ